MLTLDGYGPQILSGTITTIELSLLSLLGSFLLGLAGASAKLSRSRMLFGAATVYTTLIRAVPDLVLMLLIFYSLQIWLNDFTGYFGLEDINLDPFVSGAVTLAFIYGAYFTETFRGAFMAVPKGQMDAARAYGMRPFLAFRRILFPQMMRYALPGLANNWQVILKSTALVSLIGLADVVKAAQSAGEATFRTFFFMCIAGLVYLFLSTITRIAQYYLTRRYSVGVQKVVL